MQQATFQVRNILTWLVLLYQTVQMQNISIIVESSNWTVLILERGHYSCHRAISGKEVNL